MDFQDETEGIFGELFGSHTKKEARIISPNRPQPSATKIQDESSNQSDSEDDFALPTATPSTPAAKQRISPSEAKETTVDGGNGSSGAGAAAGAPAKARSEDDAEDETADESADETVESADETANEAGKPEPDQTKFDDFPGPTNQKETYWDSITPEQLVWYQSFPALVVPEKLHFYTKIGPQDGVMAYGPSAKNVQPPKKRYVIIQYFPLCLVCKETPQAPYARVGGQRVEGVIPYNTVMAKKASEGRELGAEDKWADTDLHYNKLKAKWKSLTERNWKASMDNVHKFLARALERKAELASQAVEDNLPAEAELERQRQEREVHEEDGEDAAGSDEEGAEAGADSADDPDATAEPQSQPLQYRKGLPLAPGDRILYWDRTKRTGAADGRMEATILEIRTKKSAREENLGLLVLDINQIVMDDWVIQRFVKDEETGEVTVAREACMVKDHKLKKGKLKGRDPLKNERMDKMISEFKEDIKAYGAGDQLRCSGGGGAEAETETETESSDDESTGSTEQQSKTTIKGKAKGSASKKKGGGKGRAGGGSSGGSVAGGSGSGRGRGRGGSGGGSVSSGRSAAPSTEDDVGDAIAASISRTKKKAKQQGGDSSRPANNAKMNTKGKDKGAKKQKEASAGKGGGRGAQKEQEVVPKKRKSDKEKGGKKDTAAQKGAAAGVSKKRSSGDDGSGERGSENAPVDVPSGGGGATGKPKVTKKRKPFSSSLVRPASDATEQQKTQKKKARKEAEKKSKPDAATGGQRAPQKKKAEQEGPPKKPPKKRYQSESDATGQLGSQKRQKTAGQRSYPEATEGQQGPPKKKEKKEEEEEEEKQQSKSDSTEEEQAPPNTKPGKGGQQKSKSPVLPGGGDAGSAGGRGDGGNNDSERKPATMARAPIASKGPKTLGWEKFKPPRKATAAGASDGGPA